MAIKPEEFNFSLNDKFKTAMIPGKFARFLRTNLIWQFIRFIVLNIKMLVVVSRSH